MIPAVFFINEKRQYEAARAGATISPMKKAGSPSAAVARELASNKRILVFTACVVFYYFANAATLPLVSEILSRSVRAMLDREMPLGK